MSALLAIWFGLPLLAFLAPYVYAACSASVRRLPGTRPLRALPTLQCVYVALVACNEVNRAIVVCELAWLEALRACRAVALAVLPNPSYCDS